MLLTSAAPSIVNSTVSSLRIFAGRTAAARAASDVQNVRCLASATLEREPTCTNNTHEQYIVMPIQITLLHIISKGLALTSSSGTSRQWSFFERVAGAAAAETLVEAERPAALPLFAIAAARAAGGAGATSPFDLVGVSSG